MRVFLAPIHETVLEDLSCQKVQRSSDHNTSPKGIGEHVPHLGVESVDLLHSLEGADLKRSVSQSPHSQVVHVSEVSPGMLEGNLGTRPVIFVLKACHARVLVEVHAVA